LQYIDKSAHKRVTHPNRAARLKSRLTRLVAARFAS
jgi:ribosomal protein S20